MILRLVLVGMVGALGVSIPAQPGCEHWYGSAQAWATSLLAQWDTWEPACDADGGPRLIVTQDQVECEECRLARMRLLAGTHEESKTEESLAQKIAEIGPPKSGADKSTDGPALVQPPEASELGIWVELCRIATEPVASGVATNAAAPAAPGLEVPDRSFICGFGDLDPSNLSAAVSPEPTEAMQNTALTSDQATESADLPVCCLDEDWSLDEVEQPETFASTPVKKFVLVDLPDDVFARAPVAPVETRTTQSTPVESPKPTHTFVLVDLPDDVFARAPLTREPATRQVPPAAAVAGAAASHQPAPVQVPPAAVLAGAAAAQFQAAAGVPPAGVLAGVAAAQIPAPACVAPPGSASQADLARAAALAAPVAREAAPATRAESPPQRLGDAVDLTRRAVSAWVSVLIGPCSWTYRDGETNPAHSTQRELQRAMAAVSRRPWPTRFCFFTRRLRIAATSQSRRSRIPVRLSRRPVR